MTAARINPFAMTIAAEIGAANTTPKNSLRLLPLESNSRKSFGFTDEEYVLRCPMHHVLDEEFDEHLHVF